MCIDLGIPYAANCKDCGKPNSTLRSDFTYRCDLCNQIYNKQR